MTLKGPSDEELAVRAAAGETTAFEVLVRRYQDRIYSFMVRLARNPATAEDLAQETFLRVWRGLHTFDPKARFAPWVYRVGLNVARDWFASVDRDVSQSWGGSAEAARDPAPGPEEHAGSAQIAAVMERRIGELPEPMKQAVLLRHRMGLSYQEIAEVMRVPVGTVKSHIFRARKLLRETFDKMMGEPCAAQR